MPEVTINTPGLHDLVAAAWIANRSFLRAILQLTRTGDDMTVIGTDSYVMLHVVIPASSCMGMEWPDGFSARVEALYDIEQIHRAIKHARSVHFRVEEWSGNNVIEVEGTDFNFIKKSVRIDLSKKAPLDISKFTDMPRDDAQGEITLTDEVLSKVGRLARKVSDDEWKLIDHGPLRAVELVGNRGSRIVAMPIRPSD